MDTYGDMVTLLLCFFVLLYSISSIDEAKMMIIVNRLSLSLQLGLFALEEEGVLKGEIDIVVAGRNADSVAGFGSGLEEREQVLHCH